MVRAATSSEWDGGVAVAGDVGEMRRASEDKRRSENGLFNTAGGMPFDMMDTAAGGAVGRAGGANNEASERRRCSANEVGGRTAVASVRRLDEAAECDADRSDGRSGDRNEASGVSVLDDVVSDGVTSRCDLDWCESDSGATSAEETSVIWSKTESMAAATSSIHNSGVVGEYVLRISMRQRSRRKTAASSSRECG